MRLKLQCRLTTLIWLALGSCLANAETFDVEGAAVGIFDAFSEIRQHSEPMAIEADRAIDVQNYLIALMRPTWGMDVGYLAEPGAGSERPPTGILLENMFTGTRAVIPRSFGIDMLASGELMFRIGSEDINGADTRESAIASLQSVIPAVRMSDQLLPPESRASVDQHTAANLQIRMFVLGHEVELSPETDWIERLPNVAITLMDQDQATVAQSDVDAPREHPIDAVLRISKTLNSRGITLRIGDVIGIGSWTDGYPVADLTRLAAVFVGLGSQDSPQVYMGFQ